MRGGTQTGEGGGRLKRVRGGTQTGEGGGLKTGEGGTLKQVRGGGTSNGVRGETQRCLFSKLICSYLKHFLLYYIFFLKSPNCNLSHKKKTSCCQQKSRLIYLHKISSCKRLSVMQNIYDYMT